MADYFVQFSCIFDVGSAENVLHAHGIAGDLPAHLDLDDDDDLGFQMEADPDSGAGALWIHAGGYGEPEHVIAFVLRCAETFNLTGLWGFCWALTCSKPRLDAFGGGAQLIDLGKRQSVAWVDCEHWLAQHLADPADLATTAATSVADKGADA
jgi:hypothetical protein